MQARREEPEPPPRNKRLELMQAGAADLEQWLLDIIRQGLATLAEQPDSYLDEMAARLVDTQLSGPARRIRQWKTLRLNDDWPERLLGELAELYLLARAWQQIDRLPETLKGEVLATSGLTTRREEVLQRQGITDRWLVAGLTEGTDENLRFRRTWLLGAGTGRTGLLLDYTWGEKPFETNWIPGSALHGELVFYPAAYPLRAILRSAEPFSEGFEIPAGYLDSQAFLSAYASATGANPWLLVFPALLEGIIPAIHQKKLFLADRQGRQLPASETKTWPLLALSAGRPLRIFGEWDGRLFFPLSVIGDDRLVIL